MTERRPDQGFSVAPRPIGDPAGAGPRRRIGRLGVAAVVLVASALVAIGWLGPRLTERPHLDVAFFATPTPGSTPFAEPSATLRATIPPEFARPTPLPAVTRTGDDGLTGAIGVAGDGFRVADLGAGAVSSPLPMNVGLDLVVPAPNGFGWVCVCANDMSIEGSASRDVDFTRIDPLGREVSRRTLASFGHPSGVAPLRSISTDLDVLPDGRSAVLAVVLQTRDEWSYSVATIDLAAGTIGPFAALGTQRPTLPPRPSPSPSIDPENPPPEPSVYGPFVRVGPDGTKAFIWSTLQEPTPDSGEHDEKVAWFVDLDRAGQPVAPRSAPGFQSLSPYCNAVAFTADDRLDALCPTYPSPQTAGDDRPTWTFSELATDGELVRQKDVPDVRSYSSDTLFDAANRIAWMWDNSRLELARIDLRSFQVTTTTFPADVDLTAGGADFAMDRPAWIRPASAVYRDLGRQMVGSASGDRLYLTAPASTTSEFGQPPSLGVFVVDPRTLALVGRWDPDALYTSVQLVDDDTILAAAGIPGYAADGREADWEASLTFHDVRDGRILLRLGQLGQAWGPSVVEP
jgi:hypothetical protein